MVYKVTATDKMTGKRSIIAKEYPSKTAFMKDVRANGYSFQDLKVKSEEVWNYIVNNLEGREAWSVSTQEDIQYIEANGFSSWLDKMLNERLDRRFGTDWRD